MKARSRLLFVGIAAALISQSTSLPANAADIAPDPLSVVETVLSSPTPEATLESLSAAEQAAFAAATTPGEALFVDASRTRTMFMGYTGCWAKVGQWTQYSTVGLAMYSWWQTTQVGASQGVTTSVSVSSFGEQALGLGWSRNGAPTTATFRTAGDGRGLVRAYCTFGTNGWNLFDATPCGQIRLGANGTPYSSSTSCILNH